ncbi:unnamed protein product [Paramecium sonneborni]|uniref:Uncharacterized protein n=1 Tax=Paramecium sonneborni TaxID=65129 RepID=A0A8S1R452_9CILI|nr:unnamed protein product [Paramecium sonneborni]
MILHNLNNNKTNLLKRKNKFQKKQLFNILNKKNKKSSINILVNNPFQINPEDELIIHFIKLTNLIPKTGRIVKLIIILEELDLYDNRLIKIENIEILINLDILDLSFNNIKKIENLDNQKKLKKLFLLSNKIKKFKIQNFLNSLCQNQHLIKLQKLKILIVYLNFKNYFQEKQNISNTLELLSLSCNKIQIIKPEIQILQNLNYLQIAENFISIIEH